MRIGSIQKLWLLALAFALVLGSAASGQSSNVPTIEEVNQKLAALQEAQVSSSDPVWTFYTHALDYLKKAADSRSKTQQFNVDAAEAPGLIASLRSELSTPNGEAEVAPAPEATLQDLEARVQQAQAELSASGGQLEELDNLASFRASRSTEIPKQLTEEQHQLGQAQESLAATAISAETEARRAELLTKIEMHTARIAELQAERASYEARRELLPLRRDRALRRNTQADKATAAWKKLVEARRKADGEQAKRLADQQFEETLKQFPALAELAERNKKLADLRSGEGGLPSRISEESRALEETKQLLVETRDRFDSARERIRVGGLTEAMGLILRLDHDWLPGAATLRLEAAVRDKKLSEAQLEEIEMKEDKAEAQDLSSSIEELLAQMNVESPSEEFANRARSLMVSRREAQGAVIDDLKTLTNLFYDHKRITTELIEAVESYRLYIEKRILWVHSSPRNPADAIAEFPGRLTEISAALLALSPLDLLNRALYEKTSTCFFLGLTILMLFLGRGLMRRKRAELGTLVRSFKTDSYGHTLRALLYTVLIALLFPLMGWTAGWIFSFSLDELGRSLGESMQEAAGVWFVIRFFRGLLGEKGVGRAHFKWQSGALKAARVELRWFEPFAVSLGFIVHTFDRHDNSDWSESAGRAAFMVLMTLLAIFFFRILRADSPLWTSEAKSKWGMIEKTRRFWSVLAIGLPIGLGSLAATGYYYTALQFELRLIYTIAFTLLLVMINAMLLRWLYMARRRLAVSQALEARAKKEEEEESENTRESGSQAFDDDKVDIPTVDASTRQLFKSSLTLATLMGLYFIWASVLPALQGLDRVQLLPHLAIVSAEVDLEPSGDSTSSQSTESTESTSSSAQTSSPMQNGLPIPNVTQPSDSAGSESDSTSGGTAEVATGLPSTLTLADVLLALVVLVLTTVAAKNLPALLELSILQRLPVDSGERYAIATLVRYMIVVIGVSAGSSALGIGWQNVQWLVAALTFGLAFGLQEIFANFVSGLIILLERPVRVGDIVTVNDREGRVTQLRMRATTIQDRDRKEILVPNKEFITGSIINWTLTDPVTRFIVRVGVAYGSDTQLARKLMLKVCQKNSLVLEDPGPEAIFIGFGESSLDFELRVFMANRDQWAMITDQLHTGIDFAFREAGIEIAFPQRDLHVRSMVPFESLERKSSDPDES